MKEKQKLEGQTEFTRREKIWMTVKYLSVAASAGVIEVGIFTLLTRLNVFKDADKPYGRSYFIALALSVLWLFTVNRRYTFKSATNLSAAMAKMFVYYIFFTIASIWWGNALTSLRPGAEWLQYVVLAGTMAINGLTDFLFQYFVLFRKSINTNDLAKKDKH